MLIHKEIDLNEPLTAEQKQMLEALKEKPVQPDEDCPELTAEQLNQLARITTMNAENKLQCSTAEAKSGKAKQLENAHDET